MKEESGEWTFEKFLHSDRGKAKMKILLDKIRAKFAPQSVWIEPNHSLWARTGFISNEKHTE